MRVRGLISRDVVPRAVRLYILYIASIRFCYLWSLALRLSRRECVNGYVRGDLYKRGREKSRGNICISERIFVVV